MLKRSAGFSLIELMIVIAIVAIVAGLALPAYQDSLRKTRRGDATQSLLALAALQERWFFTHNSYTTTLTDLGNTTNKSIDQYYSIAITADDVDKDFTITATIISTGPQKDDAAKCNVFSVNQTGAKTATTVASVDNSATCWAK